MISLYIDVFLLSLPIGSQGEILRAELVSLADINVHSELWAALSSYEWLSAIPSETPWRFFRVPWTARRAYQYILKEISPEYSLERLMLKLKLQYLGCLMWKPDSFEKTLMLGQIEGGMRRGQQRIRWWEGITKSMGRSLSKVWELVIDREASHAAVHGVSRVRHSWATELNWRSSIPGLERSPRGEYGNPLQDSSLENPMDRGAWWATVHGFAKS